MKCRKCGKEIEDNVKFCPYCGSKVGLDTIAEKKEENRKSEHRHEIMNDNNSGQHMDQSYPGTGSNTYTEFISVEEPGKQVENNKNEGAIRQFKQLILKHKLVSVCIAILIVIMIVAIVNACISRPESISATFNGVIVDGNTWDEDCDGIYVYAHYKDGSDEKVKDWTIKKPVTAKVGEKTTGVAQYKGCEAKFTIDGTSVSDGDGYFQMYPKAITQLYEQELSNRLGRKIHFDSKNNRAELDDSFYINLLFFDKRMGEDGKDIPVKKEKIPKSIAVAVYGDLAGASDDELDDARKAAITFAYIVQSEESFEDVTSDYASIYQEVMDDVHDGDYDLEDHNFSAYEDGDIGEISSRVSVHLGDLNGWVLTMDEAE